MVFIDLSCDTGYIYFHFLDLYLWELVLEGKMGPVLLILYSVLTSLRKKRVSDWVGSWELDKTTQNRWIRFSRIGGTLCSHGDTKAAAPLVAGLGKFCSDCGNSRCSRGHRIAEDIDIHPTIPST